jgi:hypothetical protein
MRARDRQAAGAMRSVLAALENAEAVPTTHAAPAAASEHYAGAADGLGAGEAARRVLTVDDERVIVEREIAELRSSAEVYAAAGEHERSSELTRLAESVEELIEAEV